MPNYLYNCPSCGDFEVQQKLADDKLEKCPTCEEPVEKLITAPAIFRVGSFTMKRPGGDFVERMAQIKKHMKKDKHVKIPDF